MAAAMLVPACGQPAITQLVVVVDTDYAVPAELDAIDVVVTGPDGASHTEHQAMARASDLPYTLAVVPSGSSLGPVRIEASGLSSGTVVVSRAARVTLVAGATVMVRLNLLRACDRSRVTCTGADQTCGDGGACVAVAVPTEPWTGTAPPRLGTDAGPSDGGVPDTGPRPDVGPYDAGPLPDVGVDCHATGCDDGEPCTDDACGADGLCTHTDNTIGCDDGLFCNGPDHCGGGSCSMHAGSPCGGAACDEAGRSCGTCVSDADCPAQVVGSFGACGGFADVCAVDGTHSRSVQTFHCNTAGACVATDSTETAACTRSSDGVMCGGTSCDPFGSCDAADFCATVGTQSRTCRDMVCRGGTCAAVPRTDTASCARATDGLACSATDCTPFGACGGFADACATSGTYSRTCTDYVCGGGSCQAQPRTDTASCSRGTDGASCGATSCSAWSGTCDYTGDCNATGQMQTRTCVDMLCSSSSCIASAPRTETQPCPTAPAGTVCTDTTYQCGVWQCNGSGACAPFSGQCGGTQVCCDSFIPARCTTARTCLL